MAISVVNLSLNAAGLAADIAGFRNITFYDQNHLETAGKWKWGNIARKIGFKISDGGGRIFNGLPISSTSVLNAGVDLQGKLCDHPIESGATVSDHKIRMPIRLKCSVVMPSILQDRVIEELNRYFETSDKVLIETPTGVYPNMVIEALPSNLTPQNVSRPVFDIVFREIVVVFPHGWFKPTEAPKYEPYSMPAIAETMKELPGKVFDWIGSF